MNEPKAPRTIRLFTLATIVIIGIVILGILRLSTWLIQPSQVLRVNNSPVPVQPPEVRDGGNVFLTIDFCKASKATGITTLNLIGETAKAKIAVSWPVDTTPKQCAVFKDVPIPIPAQTPSDVYHAEFVTCYTVNPLKHTCTTFISRSFKVVNSKLNPGDAKVSP